jgi:selenocysteine-specific elongation factor
MWQARCMDSNERLLESSHPFWSQEQPQVYVVGTAGHVDHGKSTLVQALTGIDPDRLREEKARGMTIDLGFAWLQLPGGREISIVDVPGHERFIKNMLAGVGGIDVALLVVAADEGVMPQTREHLAIIDLLGIPKGVVAITKSDLVERDWLELVCTDVEEALSETSLAGSELIPCSAETGEGLPELLTALEVAIEGTAPKRDIGRPRLWIDRAFTISGFGTVVTGTLVDGTLAAGQEVELLPDRQRARIRGLQTHRHKVERAQPGTRTAVNLAGISTDELRRGELLTSPGWLQPTTAADVRLRAVAGMARPIKHNAAVTLHTGSAEIPTKVRLLDRGDLMPGESCWAQLRLAEPIALVKGDAFVIRTPNDTVGGGSVVDSHPKRHRRHHAPTLANLALMEEGTPEETVLGLLAKLEPVSFGLLVGQTELSADTARTVLDNLLAEDRVVQLGNGGSLYTAEGYRGVLNDALQCLDAYFSDRPLRSGMPREELKSRLNASGRLFNYLVERWVAEGIVTESASLISIPGRDIRLSASQQREIDAFITSLATTPYSPPIDALPEPDLLAYLAERGDVVPVAEGIVFSREAFDAMRSRIIEHLHANGTITLAQVRDLFGTSRRYAQAVLEYLDETHVTRRIRDERVLRSPEASRR